MRFVFITAGKRLDHVEVLAILSLCDDGLSCSLKILDSESQQYDKAKKNPSLEMTRDHKG